MSAELILLPEANDDLTRTVAWYEVQRRGLGDEFHSSVKSRLESILFNPEQFERLHGNFRRAMVRRFPYAIYFESSEECVTVYGVVHHSRDEHIWRDRIPQFD